MSEGKFQFSHRTAAPECLNKKLPKAKENMIPAKQKNLKINFFESFLCQVNNFIENYLLTILLELN